MTLFALVSTLVSPAAATEPTDLTLEVRGLTATTGSVLCTLYQDPNTWLKDPGYVATTTAKATGPTTTCTFKAIPAGTYAISFIHDVNGNEDMDTNFLGMPKEPWGMSRDAPVRFGPPSFEDASFAHPSPTPQVASLR